MHCLPWKGQGSERTPLELVWCLHAAVEYAQNVAALVMLGLVSAWLSHLYRLLAVTMYSDNLGASSTTMAFSVTIHLLGLRVPSKTHYWRFQVAIRVLNQFHASIGIGQTCKSCWQGLRMLIIATGLILQNPSPALA